MMETVYETRAGPIIAVMAEALIEAWLMHLPEVTLQVQDERMRYMDSVFAGRRREHWLLSMYFLTTLSCLCE